jgi:hypothetical protein
MAPPIPGIPVPEAASGWRLTAPESYVLLNGPRARGVEAFKAGRGAPVVAYSCPSTSASPISM